MINRARAFIHDLWAPSVSSDLREQRDFAAYWAHYGGLKKLLDSPYLLTAMVIALIFIPYWVNEDWTDFASGILPNLLGFSIGAVAIILAAPSMRTFGILAEDGHPTSFFMDLAARLVHFIMLQVLALGGIMAAEAYPNKATNGVGFLLFVYAVLTAVSAGLALFGVARILNAAAAMREDVPATRGADTLARRNQDGSSDGDQS